MFYNDLDEFFYNSSILAVLLELGFFSGCVDTFLVESGVILSTILSFYTPVQLGGSKCL